MRVWLALIGLAGALTVYSLSRAAEQRQLKAEASRRLEVLLTIAQRQATLHHEVWQERSLKAIKLEVEAWPKALMLLELSDSVGLYWRWGELPRRAGFGLSRFVVAHDRPVGALTVHVSAGASQTRVALMVTLWLAAFGILVAVMERRRMKSELRLQQAGTRIAAQEQERRRLAHELHDTIGQDLAVLRMMAGEGEAAEASRRAIVDLRRIVADLHPVELDDGELSSALTGLCVRLHKASGQTIERHIDAGQPLARPLATAVFRVGQEALSNAIKHGDGGTIVVDFRQDVSSLQLTVTNGTGDASNEGSGHGLRSMRARIEHFGGRMTCGLSPEGRWSLRANIPTSHR